MDRSGQRFGHCHTLRLGEWDFPNGGRRLNTTHSISFRFIQDPQNTQVLRPELQCSMMTTSVTTPAV